MDWREMVTAVADEEFLSLIRFKLEALVELCHPSPAVLLCGSIGACRLQMGFSWAFMQTRLHRSNICREQTAKTWEAWAKGRHFQTTSNMGPPNTVPVLAPGCESWFKKKPKQTKARNKLASSSQMLMRDQFLMHVCCYSQCCVPPLLPSAYIIGYNQWTCSCKFEQRMDL